MATRKARMKFALKRFKGFWQEFRRSKRGMLGLIIVISYCIIALIAPYIAPYHPYDPKMPGYYPAGESPPIAEDLAKPIWYKTLLGLKDLSENMKPIKEHDLPTVESVEKQWNWTGNNVEIQANPNKGDRGDACVEIYYNGNGSGNARIWHEFIYPYKDKPVSFAFHISVYIVSPSETEVKMIIAKDGKITYEQTLKNLLPNSWNHQFIRSGKSAQLMSKVFPETGNYTFEVIVTFTGKEDRTLLLDNVDLIVYGEAFGLLGTDHKAGRPRDIFSTLIHGTRISLMVGLLSAIISTILGLLLGLVSGYIGGMVDEIIMRFADFLLVLPTLPLLIILMVVTRATTWNLILIISFLGWMTFSRQVRSMVLSLKERSFVEAAKACGASSSYIILRHITPNVFALVYITLAQSVPGAIIMEASISWLGLYDPSIVSWGRMLYEFSNSGVMSKGIGEYWFWVIPPGIAIMLLAIAFILMGYALDEILNPRLRERR